LVRELTRQFERLDLLTSQLKALEAERASSLAQEQTMPNVGKIAMLGRLCGVGEGGATTLVTEVFHRRFKNRKHLASYLGLAPAPYASGETSRNQGISKAGNKPARVMWSFPQGRRNRSRPETRHRALALPGAGVGPRRRKTQDRLIQVQLPTGS
jgi:transposase